MRKLFLEIHSGISAGDQLVKFVVRPPFFFSYGKPDTPFINKMNSFFFICSVSVPSRSAVFYRLIGAVYPFFHESPSYPQGNKTGD